MSRVLCGCAAPWDLPVQFCIRDRQFPGDVR